MTVARLQTTLQDALARTARDPFLPAATQLFDAMGYRSTRRIDLGDTSGATFAAAFDQEGLENPFERTDLLRNGRLRDLVDLRRFGKTLRFCKVTKHFQTLNLHSENEQQ